MLNQLAQTTHRRRGFTLVESLVVLGIISSLLILSMLTSQSLSHKSPRVERTFWHALNSNWQEARYAAKYRGQHTYIEFYASRVVFRNGGDEKFNTIIYPKTLTFLGLEKPKRDMPIKKAVPDHTDSGKPLLTVHVYADSHADPQTLLFRSKLKNGNRKLTVQMGWGLYRLEKY